MPLKMQARLYALKKGFDTKNNLLTIDSLKHFNLWSLLFLAQVFLNLLWEICIPTARIQIPQPFFQQRNTETTASDDTLACTLASRPGESGTYIETSTPEISQKTTRGLGP